MVDSPRRLRSAIERRPVAGQVDAEQTVATFRWGRASGVDAGRFLAILHRALTELDVHDFEAAYGIRCVREEAARTGLPAAEIIEAAIRRALTRRCTAHPPGRQRPDLRGAQRAWRAGPALASRTQFLDGAATD
jgi:hypothetical protein